jgi:hemolysin activation/secretion protein
MSRVTARILIAATSLFSCIPAHGEPTAPQSGVILVAPFITGSSVYSARQLSSVYSARIGSAFTTRSLASMVESIEARYRQDGFVAPVVTIEDGTELSSTPRLLIHEAAVTDVHLTGNAGPSQKELLRHIHSLTTLRPVRKAQARAILSAIQRLPGVGVRASLQPNGTALNQFTLVLAVTYHPASAVIGAANRGSRASGRDLVSGRLALNGLLGQREFLTVDGAASSAFDQYHYFGLGITRAFGSSWASLSVSNAHARPWAAEDQYDRKRYALQLVSPTWERGGARLTSLLRLVASDATLQNDEFGPLSREHLRKVEAGFSLFAGSVAAPSRISATFVQGISGLGARSVSYDDVAPADPVFAKVIVNGVRAVTLAHETRLIGRFVGEYAFDPLPTSEQFTFGGTRFGRGLEAADLAGEHGAAVSLDLEHPSPWRMLWMDSATLYTGIDYGHVWSTNAGYVRDHAASTNIGFVLEHAGFSSSFELAYSLHRPHFSETDAGVAALVELEWVL